MTDPQPVIAAVDAGHVARWASMGDGEPEAAMKCKHDGERWPCADIVAARQQVTARSLADRGAA